jgi:hypothetical protein
MIAGCREAWLLSLRLLLPIRPKNQDDGLVRADRAKLDRNFGVAIVDEAKEECWQPLGPNLACSSVSTRWQIGSWKLAHIPIIYRLPSFVHLDFLDTSSTGISPWRPVHNSKLDVPSVPAPRPTLGLALSSDLCLMFWAALWNSVLAFMASSALL